MAVKTNFSRFRNENPFTDPLHITALILARGGSKGIPLKNLAKFSNSSLISNALQHIKEVRNFNSIWVSTDNNLIASEVNKLKTQVHWRSEYTATDEASSLIAVQEFIRYHPEIDVVGLIQCTSPFIKKQYLIEAIHQFYGNPKLECVFSVTRCGIVEINEIDSFEIDTDWDLKLANLIYNLI
ncbi:N-acylneuraminate cytidylyltransferase [Chrysoperla carnea]|uniref:N-acylneuraminate cytidylyltransferase n=1 Tax=Chrysoperla carnea TaxID=189513 RepID=UPI001D05C42A|nr:N-acylneuraminate cytidylyltransferase [Chrysoperla carnea]